jgi:hypothetical protein
VTLDKSWFYCFTDQELILLPPDVKVPYRERVAVQLKTVIFGIVCGPTWFTVVTALDGGHKFNAGYYLSILLAPLSDGRDERGGGNFGNLLAHADNADPPKTAVLHQFMARNAMAITAHLPYWPDLTPFNFYLFAYVTELPPRFFFSLIDTPMLLRRRTDTRQQRSFRKHMKKIQNRSHGLLSHWNPGNRNTLKSFWPPVFPLFGCVHRSPRSPVLTPIHP